MALLVTGGAGFIGSNFVLDWLTQSDELVINLDKLSYAGNLANLASLANNPLHIFIQGDISDRTLIDHVLREHHPRALIHFAAETHVDRSIHRPGAFMQANIDGTFVLLEAVRLYLEDCDATQRQQFRFHHVSTDEVYGSLATDAPPFCESSPYQPNSPYAASKAASDHLVRAWHQTYGLPISISNCSNNYGPYQFPEKLIPLIISHALAGKPLPIYGDGQQIRDWLYVSDHCAAIRRIMAEGQVGEVYNVGGWNEMPNIEIVTSIVTLLDALRPDPAGSYARLITHVADRLGHDRRYAINASKIKQLLGWRPAETFATGIRKTVLWYLEHQDWMTQVSSGAYRQWIKQHYGERMCDQN